MSGYDNEKCGLCKGRIDAEASDIVYCPVCGTPMHRECWEIEKKCPNEARHNEGFVWEKVEEQHAEEEKANVKPLYEGQEIPQQGTPFGDFFASMPKGDENPDEEKYMGVSERELAHFCNLLQPQGIFRLSALKNMATSGRKTSFSIFAGLLKPYFQFYRGMHLEGFLILFMQTLFSMPYLILYMSSLIRPELSENLMNNTAFYSLATFFSYLGLGLTILVCLFGDYLYLRFATKKIKAIRESYREKPQEEYLSVLSQVGAPKMARVLEGVVVQVIFFIAIALVISYGL